MDVANNAVSRRTCFDAARIIEATSAAIRNAPAKRHVAREFEAAQMEMEW